MPQAEGGKDIRRQPKRETAHRLPTEVISIHNISTQFSSWYWTGTSLQPSALFKINANDITTVFVDT